MDIEETELLKYRARWDDILPALKIFRRFFKRKPGFRQALRKAMLADMDIPIPKSEETLANDPFLLLGYGVNSYFDILV